MHVCVLCVCVCVCVRACIYRCMCAGVCLSVYACACAGVCAHMCVMTQSAEYNVVCLFTLSYFVIDQFTGWKVGQLETLVCDIITNANGNVSAANS